MWFVENSINNDYWWLLKYLDEFLTIRPAVWTPHARQNYQKCFLFAEALSPAFIHAGADLWPHPLNFANAEQIQQLQQQALLHPALQHQLPVRSFLWLTDQQGNGKLFHSRDKGSPLTWAKLIKRFVESPYIIPQKCVKCSWAISSPYHTNFT